MERQEVIGNRFGRLTVIDDGGGLMEGKKKIRSVVCKCDCGTIKEHKLKYLQRGDIKSCGCLALEQKVVVIKGDTFGEWTVIGEGSPYKNKRTILSKCVCGKEKEVMLQSLVRGISKSCGCQGIPPKEKIKKEKIIPLNTEEEQWKESVTFKGYYISTLGRLFNYNKQYMFPKKRAYIIKKSERSIVNEMYKTFISEYDISVFFVKCIGECINIKNLHLISRKHNEKLLSIYYQMNKRCYNNKSKDYINYGARGIKIEGLFKEYINFYNWAINEGYEPNKKLVLDRINNDGNYSEYNCRFTSQAENNRNTTRTIFTWGLVERIRYGDLKNKSVNEIAQIIGCSKTSIKNVINYKTWNCPL